jgi:hypothetical protein
VHYGVFEIDYRLAYFFNGQVMGLIGEGFIMFNSPFLLFFFSTAANLHFVIKLAKTKHPTPKKVLEHSKKLNPISYDNRNLRVMHRDFKQILVVNGVLVFLYVFFNWVEYSLLNSPKLIHPDQITKISTHFPLYFEINSHNPALNGIELIVVTNYTLIIFLIAVFVNLYLAFRLQGRKC